MVERQTFSRGDRGSNHLLPFCVHPLCLCLSEETLKAVGPFYLMSMPGEVKDPTQGKCVTCCGLHLSRATAEVAQTILLITSQEDTIK